MGKRDRGDCKEEGYARAVREIEGSDDVISKEMELMRMALMRQEELILNHLNAGKSTCEENSRRNQGDEGDSLRLMQIVERQERAMQTVLARVNNLEAVGTRSSPDYAVSRPVNGVNVSKVATCHGCGEVGHIRPVCPLRMSNPGVGR